MWDFIKKKKFQSYSCWNLNLKKFSEPPLYKRASLMPDMHEAQCEERNTLKAVRNDKNTPFHYVQQIH